MPDLGRARQSAEDEKVGTVGILRTRQPRETQLSRELSPVLVLAGHNEGTTSRASYLAGDTRRDFSVPGKEPKHRSAMVGRVVLAARLVVAGHPSPRGHGSE